MTAPQPFISQTRAARARRAAPTALALTLALAAACGAPHAVAPATTTIATTTPTTAAPATAPAPDPDLNRPPPRRLLAIDWAHTALASDDDARALWRRIAPTGADWDDKLAEVPATAAAPLARALLRDGNVTCATPPTGTCAKQAYEVPAPAETAGLDDPCLRRLLALWSLAQLDEDVPAELDEPLRALAAIPPPESQLVASALHARRSAAQDVRLELLGIAWRAGHRDLVEAELGGLDSAHQVAAVQRHHIGGALEPLPASEFRAVYVAAITDDALDARARTAAITELTAGVDALPTDVRNALVAATKARDCAVAAAAARALDQRGDHRFVPKRPSAAGQPALPRAMRAMCVLASYEALQGNAESSLLASYLPARGLERVTIAYDALSDTDPDGDGDPHTTQTVELVARDDAVLPELEDLARAMQRCTGAICVSDDHEFRFVWKSIGGQLMLIRLDVAERPPCTAP